MSNKDYLLNNEELSLSSDASVMLMKNELISKVIKSFSIIAEDYKSIYSKQNILNIGHSIQNPKIARGEQYLGLPYVMLDFPREFSKENIFAIRSMWWWGNDFSISLHLKGNYHQEAKTFLINSYELLQDYFINNSEDEWDHHIKGNGYIAVNNISPVEFENKIINGRFLKLAKSFPINEWNRADELMPAHFKKILMLLH